jgi:hypothetical protein
MPFHRFRRAAFAACMLAGCALGGASLAQEGACRTDLAKFCPQATPGSGKISACLKANAAQLSPTCKARVGEMTSLIKEADVACEEDIHAYCGAASAGGGRVAACLKQNAAKLSPVCKAKLEQVKSAY